MNNLILAEICGIHAGDGYLRNDGKRIELDISGNVEEKEFYENYIIPLFSKFFKIKLNGKYFASRNTYGFVIRNKKIVKFFHKLGFPYGKKTLNVEIPKFILESKDLRLFKNFMRGLFDTDGSFTPDKKYSKYNYYPRICISTCSVKLSKQVYNLLVKIGINPYIQIQISKKINENIRYKIWIVGKKKVEKWMNEIGSKNSINFSKYQIWKKFGFCPPYTTLEQRKQILKNELDPFLFYGPVA